MVEVFKKIKLQKVSEEIAEQIRGLISAGELQSGEKLPPERTLSEMLGVARSSLREAINILDTQGFVETRKRQGIYICSLSKTIIPDPLRMILEEDKNKLLQLYEVRKDIELASAFSAAEHRTKADLTKIKKAFEKMESDAKNDDMALGDDLDFHLAIAGAGHNIFRGHILRNIFDISDEYLQYLKGVMTSEKDHIGKLLEQHRNIFLAIEQKDPVAARKMMLQHLNWVEGKWQVICKTKF